MSSKVEIQTNPATATPSLSPPSSSASTSVPPSSNKSTTTTKNNDNGNDNNKTSAQQDEVPMKRKIQQLQMDPLHLQHLQNVIDPCH